MSLKTIPETTAVTYISGLHSLNLDLQDGTGCGWHFSNLWLGGRAPIRLYGKGTPVDTIPMFGYFGVADRSKVLRKFGFKSNKVYIANHTRAVLDSVYESLKKYKHVGEIYGSVDYFFETEEQKKELFDYLVQMSDYLDDERRDTLYDWLSSEFRPFYKRWRSGKLQAKKNISDL